MPITNPFEGGGESTAPAAPSVPEAPAAPTGGGGITNPFASQGAVPALPTQATTEKKSGGGLLSKALHAISPIGTVLNAPEQVVFHGASALGDALAGRGKEALHTLSQTPGAVIGKPEDELTYLGAMGKENAKLPTGLHTALNIGGGAAADPLNFVTLGLGPEARAAQKAINATEGGADIVNTIRKGGMDALDEGTKNQIRETLIKRAGEGARPAEEVADKQMAALAKRGQGGLGIKIPGMDTVAHIAGNFDRPEVAKAIGDQFPRLAKLFSPAREERVLADQAAKEAATGEAARVAQSAKHIGSGEDLMKAVDKVSRVTRSQLLAFPGTVANRMRRGIMVNLLDGVAPERQIALGKEYRALTKAGKAAEEGIGINPMKLDNLVDREIADRSRDIEKFDKAREAGIPAESEEAVAAARDQASADAVKKEMARQQAIKDSTGRRPNGFKSMLTKASRNAREAAGVPGGVIRPTEHTYQSAMESVLGKMGVTTDMFKQELARSGVENPDRYLRLRQILHEGGGNMYREGGQGERILKEGGGKIKGALRKAGELERSKFTTPIRKAGTAVENLNRGVSALHNLDRYGNVEEAVHHVANVMGDPWKLTHGEKLISPITPFWGAIRNHIETVARTGFDNPARVSVLEHLIKNTPLGQGSGDPIGSSANVLDAPARVGLGLAGAAGSAVGHPFAQGQLAEGLKGIGGLAAGAPAAGMRLAASPEMLGKAPGKAVINAIKTSSPTIQRLPIPGKKKSLKDQIEKFLAGVTLTGG